MLFRYQMRLYFWLFFNRLPTGWNLLFRLPDVWAKPLPPPALMIILNIVSGWVWSRANWSLLNRMVWNFSDKSAISEYTRIWCISCNCSHYLFSFSMIIFCLAKRTDSIRRLFWKFSFVISKFLFALSAVSCGNKLKICPKKISLYALLADHDQCEGCLRQLRRLG